MNTPDEILNKLFRYCAYQERCKQEVRKKMKELGAESSEFDDIIDYLEEESFIDEARFACVFAGGKFRVKRWGRRKITNELRKRNIPNRFIERALKQEIPIADYENTLLYLIEKKFPHPIIKLSLEDKQKLFRFLQQKGYEWDVIRKVWDDWQDQERT